MKIGTRVSGLMLALTVGGILMTSQIVNAPPAQACSGMTDPITGLCWSGSAAGGGISGTGGTCMPGRLGLCLGGLANSQMQGANLPDQSYGPTSRPGSWP